MTSLCSAHRVTGWPATQSRQAANDHPSRARGRFWIGRPDSSAAVQICGMAQASDRQGIPVTAASRPSGTGASLRPLPASQERNPAGWMWFGPARRCR